MTWPLALLIGVLLSLGFLHCTGWSPGGLITPGYLLLALRGGDGPALLALAALTWLAALSLKRWLPMYGRRRWTVCLVLSLGIGAALQRWLGFGEPLGLIVPGLMASALLSQGWAPTLVSTVCVTAATWWALIALGAM